jgi:Calcineurin-like phosphoesterase
MGPVKARSLVGAALGVSAILGLPLLHPRSGEPVSPAGSETAIVDTATTDTLVYDSTTVVDSSSVPPSSSDSTGVDSSTVPDSTVPDPTTPPPPIVVAAAGDLSCPLSDPVTPTKCQAGAVSDALLGLPDLQQFFALGDLQYVAGSLKDFTSSYELTYGRLKAITRPAVGNHEYMTKGATGYFTYFGAAAGTPGEGWYSFDLGSTWHVVVLNSNCARVRCDVGSPQEQWLRTDLAASTRPCTIGFWHHPLFSSGDHHGGDVRTAALWQALLDNGAEVILTSHDHDYERFAPQLADGTPSDLGIRAFVVGTGGRSQHVFAPTPELNSEVRLSSFGYLRLALGESGYDFAFVSPDGTVLDQGSGTCHAPAPPPPDTTTTTVAPAPPPASPPTT